MNKFFVSTLMSILLLPIWHTVAQEKPDDLLFAKDFVVCKPSSNILIVTSLTTRETFTNHFDGVLSNIETCPVASYVSFGLTHLGSLNRQYGLFDLKSRAVFLHPVFMLDSDERRWSPSGGNTYVKLDDAVFGVLATSNLHNFVQTYATNLCSIIVAGDRAGTVFQEEWLNDRFLIFGTGQGTEMAWGLLDTSERCCFYLDALGYRGRPRLSRTLRSPNRLRYLAAEALRFRPCGTSAYCDFFAYISNLLGLASQ